MQVGGWGPRRQDVVRAEMWACGHQVVWGRPRASPIIDLFQGKGIHGSIPSRHRRHLPWFVSTTVTSVWRMDYRFKSGWEELEEQVEDLARMIPPKAMK